MTESQAPLDRPQSALLERFIEDAGSPARLKPDDIDVSSPGFWQFLHEVALPVVGGNAVLWGLYKVGQTGGAPERWLLWVALAIGTVALGALIARRVSDISIGVLATTIMVASSG